MQLLLTATALLVAGTSAFAPARTSTSSTTTLQAGNPAFKDELGAQLPLGMFDPLGVVDSADQAEFDRLRWVELKHGRVAMLAVVGYLTTYAGVRFPGLEDVPCGFPAFSNLPDTVFGQLGMTWIMMEMANRDQTGGQAEFIGDFRNNKLDFGWDKQTDEWKMKKRAVELNNGRAAQMGILGLMVHEVMGNVGDILPLAK